jgi:hypothetical protein
MPLRPATAPADEDDVSLDCSQSPTDSRDLRSKGASRGEFTRGKTASFQSMAGCGNMPRSRLMGYRRRKARNT